MHAAASSSSTSSAKSAPARRLVLLVVVLFAASTLGWITVRGEVEGVDPVVTGAPPPVVARTPMADRASVPAAGGDDRVSQGHHRSAEEEESNDEKDTANNGEHHDGKISDGTKPSVTTGAASPCRARKLMYCPVDDETLAGGGEPGDATLAAADVTVVMGIPTVDTSFGAERRLYQRDSWFTYPSVWRGRKQDSKKNPSSDGRMVLTPRYILARHPSTDFSISKDLEKEARAEGDIIAFDMREGRPATNKKPGQAGYWGLEAEVGMSRKAFAWYCYAAVTYPRAKYIMKGDDDIYLRVELYLRSLDVLARVAASRGKPLYWGPVMMWGAKKGDPKSKFAFVGGMSITLDRRLAEWIATDKRGSVNMGPYHGDKAQYKATNHDHEDVMVGRMFYDAGVKHLCVRDRRFHDIHTGANVKPLAESSLGIHHLKHGGSEYDGFRSRFEDSSQADLQRAADRAQKNVESSVKEMRPGVDFATIDR